MAIASSTFHHHRDRRNAKETIATLGFDIGYAFSDTSMIALKFHNSKISTDDSELLTRCLRILCKKHFFARSFTNELYYLDFGDAELPDGFLEKARLEYPNSTVHSFRSDHPPTMQDGG